MIIMRFKYQSTLLFVMLLITAINKTTLANSSIVNFDTAWTFVYDGGKTIDDRVIEDDFSDVKVLPDSGTIIMGTTRDTLGFGSILLVRLSKSGELVWKKLYARSSGGAILVLKNGDYIIGGSKYGGPLLHRTDSLGNIKWTAWYYDSLKSKTIFLNSATINSLRETSSGRIICAIGETFPGKAGDPLDNYAAYLEYDSLGTMTNWGQWWEDVGYKIAGFSIEEMSANRFVIAGNQAVIGIDTAGTKVWQNSYSFWLDGVGTVTNNVTCVNKLRDGTIMVIGQAYEANCWTYYQRLSYDAWWSPISSAGENAAWDTAGHQGGDDELYDFTQLNDGKLVFVGYRSTAMMTGGLWAFVTDSTGKNILWEKIIRIKYGTDDGGGVNPYSVCATPDGGFTVAGPNNCSVENGGPNAFVAHYIPKDITVIKNTSPKITNTIIVHSMVKGSMVTFKINSDTRFPSEIIIFNAAGKTVKSLPINNIESGNNSLTWDCTFIAKGLYLYRIKTNNNLFTGRFTIGM